MKYLFTFSTIPANFFQSLFKASLIWIGLTSSLMLQAQSDSDTDEPHKIQFAAGLSTGLHAIVGLDIAANVLPNLGVRVGYNYLQFSKNNYETSLNDLGIGSSTTPFFLDTNPKLSTAQLMAEYMPGPDRMFRIQAGFALALDNKIEVSGRYGDTFYFNDFPVTPEQLGNLTITYTSNKILPYLGLGFGDVVPKKRVSFSLEVGAYYRGKPDITITGTELFEPNNTNPNGEIISENASKYKIHPVVAFRLGVRLTN